MKRGRAWFKLRILGVTLVLCALAGCDRDKSRAKSEPQSAQTQAGPQATEPPQAQTLTARLPDNDAPYFPSLIRSDGKKPVDVAALADVKACATCHEEAAHQWESSAHAHSSFDNPWYRASVDAVRGERGNASSRLCGGCHDPLLVFGDKIEADIDPADPLARAGVTCLVCHSIQAATVDGNASFTLDTTAVPIPRPGDEESLRRHRARVAPSVLSSPALCASCHRAFLGREMGIGHHLLGIDEPGAWRASVFGGSGRRTLEHAPARTCAHCHMAPEHARLADPSARRGKLRSHRFAGAHTAIAVQSDDPHQLEVISEQLKGSATIDAPVLWQNGQQRLSADPITLQAEDRLALDVTLRNGGVGHQFPGGVKDLQDTWVELELRDAQGRILAQAGKDQARREDASAFVLRALVVDATGAPEARHIVTHFGTVAYDHSVDPLSARVVRYTFTWPTSARPPLVARLRLLHRKHRQDARELACEASRSTRGRAFISASREQGKLALDGCHDEPITVVAEAELRIGATPQHSPTERPHWARLYDHALALSLGLQERLDEARASANAALAALDDASDTEPNDRAMLLVLLGDIAAKQGRLQEALDFADRAEALVGDQSAIEHVRAGAYAQVWRWPEAATAFAKVTSFSRFDTTAYRDLALARMSANQPLGALAAAQSGLELQPRDEDLLRAQTLALEAEHSPAAKEARRAFLFYRNADDATTSRIACDRRVETCARDRIPVVTIDLPAE